MKRFRLGLLALVFVLGTAACDSPTEISTSECRHGVPTMGSDC